MTEASFLQALGWAILNSLWQLALLWVIYQLCISIYPTARPATKSSLASSLLFGGFAWFVYTLCIGLSAGSTAATLFSATAGNNSLLGLTNNFVRRSLPFASIIYLILLLIPLLRFTRNYRYVQVISHNGLSKMDADWRLFVNKIASQMGMKKPVKVWVSEWVNSPVTIGFLKPIILVPMAAINHLSTSQMEAILLHELSHIRRMDYLMNFLLNMVRVILYFNPFVKAFVRIVESEREKSCDEMVLQFQYDTYDYASALLTLEKVSRRHQVLVVAAAGNTDLLTRIELMMGIRKNDRFNIRKGMAILSGLLCVISVNALMLVSSSNKAKLIAKHDATLMTDGIDGKNMAALIENPEHIVSNALKQSAEHKTIPPPVPSNALPVPQSAPVAPGIIAAKYDLDLARQVALTQAQEQQVKEALEASRKLAENAQWQQVEKNLADVFSEEEKAELKKEWRNQVNKFDWKQWEGKLRNAYDQVDWNKVNMQLNYAVNQIHVDSLIKVYTNTMVDLNNVKKELCLDSIKGIPDTDITLKSIADKQKQVEKAMRQLRALRNRKVIHL